MILNNYWKWLKANQNISIYSSSNDLDIGLKDITGAAANVYWGDNSGSALNNIRNGADPNRVLINDLSVRLGTGTSTISSSDYALANDITSSISDLTSNLASVATNKLERIITVTGTNNTNADITITQVAICKGVSNDWSHSNLKIVMFAACNLNSPLTVESGESFAVTVNWTEQ